MEFKFVPVKLQMKDCKPIDYGYCLVLDSFVKLAEFDTSLKTVYERGFVDAVETMQHGHPRSSIGYMTNRVAETKEISIIEAFIDVTNRAFMAKRRAIQRFGKIYIQKNMQSFFVPGKDVVEYDEPVITGLSEWPDLQKKVKITKWPGGSHYYATYGLETVEVDGCVKWNTLEGAQAAIAKYLKQTKSDVDN